MQKKKNTGKKIRFFHETFHVSGAKNFFCWGFFLFGCGNREDYDVTSMKSECHFFFDIFVG